MTNEIVRNSPSFNFQSLPTELTLEALSYLIIPHLFILRLLSRYWKDFFLVNESSIYRNAAHLHRFIDSPGISLLDAKLLCSDRLMKGVDSWKMFCQRRFQVEKSWVGRSLSVMQESNIMALAIQHFRVDDKHGCIIYSTLYGGLFVADIIQGRVLWSLSTDYVPHGAKCEFDEGYLLFNRDNDYIEVWRRSCDFNNAILPAVSEPDEMQWDAFVKASERHRSDKPRGHFRPWTLLQVPSVTAATLCFLYPTFLVVYKEHAILWDIPTSQVSLTITFAQSAMIDRSHGCTNNAQLTETLIFICFDKQMTVFSRVDGAQLYSLSISQISHGFTNLEILSNEPYSQTSAAADGAVLIPRTVHVYKQSDSWGDSGYFVSDHKFASVHASGSDLVVLLRSAQMVIIRNLQSIIRGEMALSDTALDIDLTQFSRSDLNTLPSLTVRNGKVVVATTSGITVIALDGIRTSDSMSHQPALFPNISVCCTTSPCITSFLDGHALPAHWMHPQMTDTSIYFRYSQAPSYIMSATATQVTFGPPNNLDDSDSDHMSDDDMPDLVYTDSKEAIFCIDFMPQGDKHS